MKAALSRRLFLKSTASFAAFSFWPGAMCPAFPGQLVQPRPKKPARLRGAFFYPPAEVVLEGRNEDSWAKEKWFTWPGNQFQPELQQARFVQKVKELTQGLDLDVNLETAPLYTDAAIQAFIASLKVAPPEALLLFNFWNSFSPKLRQILDAWTGPVILYHPVGANHQLPPDYFRNAPRLQYIHSIENWEALGRGLRCVHAVNRMRQSRVLRISGQAAARGEATEPFFGLEIRTLPAAEFNSIYDAVPPSRELEQLARSVRRQARRVRDLSGEALLQAAKAHLAVREIMAAHQADAITIECLFLKHRKPCLSFALNNGNLVPCGCENHLDATLTLLLGAACFGRGGFQHNPEFDTEQNLYFASHCTCTTRLHGPQAQEAPYDLRPFFHQMPKTLALDVHWPPGETATLCKYQSGQNRIDAWRGTIVRSPESPPTGGCATRVLVRLDQLPDVCTAYSGPHPVLYCGDFAPHLKTLGRLYGLEVRGNC